MLGKIVVVAIYAALIGLIGSAIYTSTVAGDECTNKGGTYVKIAAGGYVCAKLETVQ